MLESKTSEGARLSMVIGPRVNDFTITRPSAWILKSFLTLTNNDIHAYSWLAHSILNRTPSVKHLRKRSLQALVLYAGVCLSPTIQEVDEPGVEALANGGQYFKLFDGVGTWLDDHHPYSAIEAKSLRAS